MNDQRRRVPQQGLRRTALRHLILAAVVGVAVTGCGEADSVAETSVPAEGCADVIEATVVRSGDRFVVTATVASSDTGWDRYADAWEVRTTAGDVLGTRVLAHPHVDEQPFTRSLNDVEIPPGVATVEVAARDSVVGFCGVIATAAVPAP